MSSYRLQSVTTVVGLTIKLCSGVTTSMLFADKDVPMKC